MVICIPAFIQRSLCLQKVIRQVLQSSLSRERVVGLGFEFTAGFTVFLLCLLVIISHLLAFPKLYLKKKLEKINIKLEYIYFICHWIWMKYFRFCSSVKSLKCFSINKASLKGRNPLCIKRWYLQIQCRINMEPKTYKQSPEKESPWAPQQWAT